MTDTSPVGAASYVAVMASAGTTDAVPLWLAVVVALGTPVLAFAGALLGQLLTRRGAKELDIRWRREETMRLLRWAAELAVDEDVGRGAVGVAALEALEVSALLQKDDQALISAVLDAVVEPVVDVYDEGDLVQEVD
jgi:hypothetical protein